MKVLIVLPKNLKRASRGGRSQHSIASRKEVTDDR